MARVQLNPQRFLGGSLRCQAGFTDDGLGNCVQVGSVGVVPTGALDLSLGDIFGGIKKGLGSIIDAVVPGGTGSIPGRIPDIIKTFAPQEEGCLPGFQRDSRGRCLPGIFVPGPIPNGIAKPELNGGARGPTPMGGSSPGVVEGLRRVCGRGSVLGHDGLCYDRRTIRNDDRMWPRSRKPLLTGGDLNAISKASRAATRIEKQTKRLQKLGMLRKPSPRRAAPSQPVVIHHDGHHATIT